MSGLHEVDGERTGHADSDDAGDREEIGVVQTQVVGVQRGLNAQQHRLAQRRHECGVQAAQEHVGECRRAAAPCEKQADEGDQQHREQDDQNGDQLAVTDRFLHAHGSGDRNEDGQTSHTEHDREDLAEVRRLAGDDRREDRRKDERHHADRLHHDERRKREGCQLREDRHAEHDRPRKPDGGA